MIDNVEKEKQQKWATTRLKKKRKLTPEKLFRIRSRTAVKRKKKKEKKKCNCRNTAWLNWKQIYQSYYNDNWLLKITNKDIVKMEEGEVCILGKDMWW